MGFATLYEGRQPQPVRTIFDGRRWMSVRPAVSASSSADGPGVSTSTLPAPRKKVTIRHLQQLRDMGTPITMLTAYDYPTARALDSHGVDIALVGDSLAQVCLGLPSTTLLTLDEMLHHCRAVARGCTYPFLVADMPFGSYHTSVEAAAANAIRMVQEGRVEAVKLEGGAEITEIVSRLTTIGVPVMGHVGLLPQRHVSLSGYRVQGQKAAGALGVLRAAQSLQSAGAFALVLEAVPHRLAEYITARLAIPTIGIGAGPRTSGQVLVWDDAMSRWHGRKAKFVRRFADVGGTEAAGVNEYVAAVRDGSFPDPVEEGYSISEEEWERFLDEAGDRGWRGPSRETSATVASEARKAHVPEGVLPLGKLVRAHS
ncbi:ketopantoate hydroxymethyltransferase [Vararia minispora EC-137]|uniref:Ketopantoate hydroxymethyltransferase n=1 Tax=Vararia minispora EC-137 TaxID=1314806 RepID=A0ACB8QB01_9AGAM|nr:ketopantoate hydroxymethyltransferase [Vararia minispora EC-137]